MITKCEEADFSTIYEIINDGATAYKGVIPADRWHEPYMSEESLQTQLDEGVEFWKYIEDEKVIGVMGLQDKGEVILIRHAYVRTACRNKGIGTKLLNHLCAMTNKPILIGTWKDAHWAIDFYEKHGFRLLSAFETVTLLYKYWRIPDRQVETSVVLSNR